MEILSFEMTPFAMNCYVIKDGGEAIVIDPGEATAELKASVADDTVTMIFNTHCHIDHSGGNAGMVAATGAPSSATATTSPSCNPWSSRA